MAHSNTEQGEHMAELEAGTVLPPLLVQQAAAVARTEYDNNSTTSAERRHMGQDVPIDSASSFAAETEQAEVDVPPPAYGEHYGVMSSEQQGLGTKAIVADDGRVNININQLNRRLSTIFVPALRQQSSIAESEEVPPPPYVPPSLGGEEGVPPPPPMNVVIQVVGSRGDVQPFIALGKVLKETYGHRLRLATHPNFQQFVTENGLEFFSIGGDPAKLMAFMVKNPGLMPGFETLRSGDIGDRRREVGEYMRGCWRSCYEAGNGLGLAADDDTIEDWTRHEGDPTDDPNRPFVADCIIANPPSFAHIHCAEKLGIPLHVMFTMPYSPTQIFPHPLANIQSSNADQHLTNYISYALIDLLTWQGLGDVINRFRQKQLGLDAISLAWAPGMLQRLKIPHTYCWSPALIPKPRDWGQHISISGFYFLNLATNYTPAPDLQEFLDAGPPPVYIGFGSIVLDDPDGMTKLIFEAVEKSGQRALVSKGWGGMGADTLGQPDNVFMLGNVPHDWLFQHISCVVHHGGAGTTAAGITAGRPTVVVPFFGDQQFWGAMVARAGAGPQPIPHKQLTAEKLAEAISMCLKPESKAKAQSLAQKIASERGTDDGAQRFHQFLDVDKLRCSLTPSRTAVWRIKRTEMRLSAFAACTLANEGLLDFKDIKLFRPREYETDEGPWDPITGGSSALIGTFSTMLMGVADFPIETLKALKIHPDSNKGKSKEDQGSPEVAVSKPTGDDSNRTSGDASSSYAASSLNEPASAATSPDLTPSSSRTNSTFNFQESMARIPSPPTSADGRLSPRHVSASMQEALNGHLNSHARTRSRSASRNRNSSHAQADKPASVTNIMETTIGTSKGIRRIIDAGITSPMDFSLSVAKGFHNAPKLYGDDTVRKHDKVTNAKSGMMTAGKEFGFGLYDGITGLVTQPLRGAQKEGVTGFVKGIGKGIGGVVLKPSAAVFGIPGYMMKGMYKEMQKHFGSSVQNYIIAARTAQGYDEWQRSSEAERKDVVLRYKHLQKDLKKKRNPDEMMRDVLADHKKKHHEFVERMHDKRHSRSRIPNTDTLIHTQSNPEASPDAETAMLDLRSADAQIHHAHTFSGAGPEDADLEEAIRKSVQDTSCGDAREDAELDQAMRASLVALQNQPAGGRDDEDEDEGLRQALAASTAEAQQSSHSASTHDAELKRALAHSLEEHDRQQSDSSRHDEEYQRALAESQRHAVPFEKPPAYDPGHLAGVTQEEFEQQSARVGGRAEKTQEEREEERVVLAYVKKQSALEEQHRREAEAGKGKGRVVAIPEDAKEDESAPPASKVSAQQSDEASGS